MAYKIIPSILCCVFITMTSCSPVVYSTVGQNVPLFHTKAEASINASYASTDDADGFSVQAAGSLTDHVALISSFYRLSQEAPSDAWSGHGSYFELGGGGFSTFGNKNNFVFEVFGGAGFGKIENSRDETNAHVKFVKPFIQPSIGITGKWFEAAFTPRIGLVAYTDYRYASPDPDESAILTATIDSEKNTFVFEPGITLRGGYKALKLQLQFNYTTFSPWKSTPDNAEPNINEEFFSIGIHYLISKRYGE